MKVTTSNPDKVFFPGEGITKGVVVDHYRRVAPLMLAYTKGRAIVMERFPNGIDEGRFYQKDASDYFPKWINRARLEKKGGTVNYVLGDDPDTIVYLANQGTITFHSLLSRAKKPHFPDQMIIDLDPSGSDFANVIRGAKLFRRLLDELGLESFVKTTGSRGLHVCVPLDAKSEFDQVRDFSAALASAIATAHSDVFTMEHLKENRRGRIYLDVGRNAYSQHAVLPYSIRALPGAPVAVPLSWDELKAGLHPGKFTLANLARRLARKEDPWANFFSKRQSIRMARQRFDKRRDRAG